MINAVRLMAPLAWRNLWRRGARTLFTMLAVLIAVGSLVVLGSLFRAWGSSAFDRTVDALTGHGQIHAKGFLDDPTIDHTMPFPAGALAQTLSGRTVAAWAPRVVAPALIRSERESAPITLYGVDPAREPTVSFLKPSAVKGTYLGEETGSGLVMGRLLAERLQVELGHRVVITAQAASGDIVEIGARVIGFYQGQPDLQKYAVFLPLAKAQSLLRLQDRISEIAFLAPRRDAIDAATAALAAAAPELDVRRWDSLQPFAKGVVELAEGTNAIWIFVSFVLVAFGLVNTLVLAVFERMREFGLMQALGMRPMLLLTQVLLESAYLVSLGTLGGAAIGTGIVGSLRGGLHLGSLGIGAEMFGAGQTLYPEVHAGQIAIACIVVVGLSVLASLYPAMQAARRVPIDILTRART
jgi:ABC-type lipoprotein release transport system permease subunit